MPKNIGEFHMHFVAYAVGAMLRATPTAMSSPARIVICGGGAVGAAIAYFTSRRSARSTVIERHAIAGAASGKSRGFLALDWCRGSALDQLARRSFELHAELSAELGIPGQTHATRQIIPSSAQRRPSATRAQPKRDRSIV
jgi:glycine/D-amino acid oxidase-like deaminating enzyme